ncbi:MAG: glycosyltransferase family 39 protein [Patescibacteria group bacterium]
MKKYSPLFFIILIIGTFFAFFMLGHGAFIDNDEAFYAQTVRESLEHNNFITLTHSGNNWFDKPPLVFWFVIGSVKIFGYNEFALRFPIALSLVLCLFLTYLCTYELTNNKRTAIIASLVLLTTGLFWEAGRQLRLDVPVTACVLFSFYSYLKGLKNPRWFLGIGVGFGLGIMTKSVIGLLSIPVIIIYSIFYKKWNYLRDRNFYCGLLLGAVIGLPWHIYEWLKYPTDFYNLYIVKFIFTRIHENILGGVSTNANYIINLFTYYEPWIIIALICIFCSKMKLPRVFLIICFCLFAVFFVSSTKLLYYFVPIYPFMAIFIALSLDSIFSFIEMYHTRYKDFVIFLYSLLFIFALITSIYTTFGLGDNYFSEVKRLATQEKIIGELIAKNSTTIPIYIYNYFYWDTIVYYSGGRKIEVFDEKTATRPFYLILSSQLKINADNLYKGDNLSLFYVH